MFTGLVETIGKVVRVVPKQGNRRLVIEAEFARELQPGESVAVNGCCLTVVAADSARFTVEAVAETLKRTNLRELRSGMPVNLERALRFTDRLGGHFVLGHIDEVGTVRRLEYRSNEFRLFVAVKEASFRLLVEKGSVAIDGVSLTVAGVKRGEFWVNLIPFTWERTTLNRCRAGTRVNLEYDILVKAAQRDQGPHPLVPHRTE